MKLILSVITVMLSFNSFAQTAATELTHEEKVAAFTRLSQFVPQGQFKGNIVTQNEEGNLLQTNNCRVLYSDLEPGISAAMYERPFLKLGAFTADGHSDKPMGITYMTAGDKIIQATFSDDRASITSEEKTDGTLSTLDIRKFNNNHALFTVTYTKVDGSKQTTGCNVNFNRRMKN